MKKFASLFLALVFITALAVPVFADSDASGESDSAGPRDSSGIVAITVEDGEVTVDDSVDIETADSAVIDAAEVSGVSIASDSAEVGGVAWYGEDDFLLGGEEDNFTVTTYYTEEDLDFNTVISLALPEDFDWSSSSSGGFGVTASGESTIRMENVYVMSTGIGRYSLDAASGTNIVKDCYFESLGCRGEYCDMPWFTMQFGATRNTIMVDTANMYVYNSMCATDGYASWSTDMTNGSLYLYNADCINYNGGYGSYADGCRVYVYGSSFDCGEYGLFDCNGGTIVVGSSDDAMSAGDAVFLQNLQGEELEEDTPSVIVGDRNAVAMHVVATSAASDEMRGEIVDTDTSEMYTTQPTLYATNSTFSTVGATGTSLASFPVTIEMYLDLQKGSVFEFRSCSADVYLENCELESSNGVLFQSIIDLDGSAVQILDDVSTEDIPGICIYSAANDWTGDIDHMDYQRPMYLTLESTTLTGAIYAGTLEEWLALWEDYADVSYSLDDETGLYVNDADPDDTAENFRLQDPDEIYAWATAITEYDTVRGVYLTMDSSSVWNVTDESQLVSLTMEDGAVINGTVTVDGEEVDTSAGGEWAGEIVVTPA